MSHLLGRAIEHKRPRQRRVLRRLTQLTEVVLLGCSTARVLESPARAWGRFGHRSSAKLAQARLNPAARKAIVQLLEPGESLADISLWADEQRRSQPQTGPWHYVNIPLTEERYAAKFCPEQGCVVSKVEDFRKQLADANLTREERQKALKFLVHFVQDMHQPLHVGHRDDRGGNDLQVQFFGEGSNLHRVWDSGLIERQYQDEAALVADLEKIAVAGTTARWESGSVEDWATESLLVARRAYVDPYTKSALRSGNKLGLPYLETNLPSALERVAQSGVRLAAMLNAIFPEER